MIIGVKQTWETKDCWWRWEMRTMELLLISNLRKQTRRLINNEGNLKCWWWSLSRLKWSHFRNHIWYIYIYIENFKRDQQRIQIFWNWVSENVRMCCWWRSGLKIQSIKVAIRNTANARTPVRKFPIFWYSEVLWSSMRATTLLMGKKPKYERVCGKSVFWACPDDEKRDFPVLKTTDAIFATDSTVKVLVP